MRKLSNWIDAFMLYTEGRGSPRLYRLWSAIFAIGAACERRVWVNNVRGISFPNQYILLVGGPGIGKSLCTSLVYDLLQAIRTPETPFHLAPTSMTKASLIDALAAAERRVPRPAEDPSVVAFNSLTVIANEFGVFLPAWEGDFMAVLTDLWDCKQHSETRRTKSLNISIPNVQLSILSADTPAHLTNLLPEGAWETGFMSRTLMVYSGESLYIDPFAELDVDPQLRPDLIHDLKDIYKMYGELEFTKEVQQAIGAWGRSGYEPRPDHPKLEHYCTRREHHLFKLCMIASVADNSEGVVTLDHYQQALAWLVELETFMPDVFRSMTTGGDMRAMEECWHYAMQSWMKNKKPVSESLIWHFLSEKTPAHRVPHLIEAMVKQGVLVKANDDNLKPAYEPRSKQPR